MRLQALLSPWAALTGILALLAQPAAAGSLNVAPILVEVDAGRQFCSLTVGNGGDQPVRIQVRPFDWSRSEQGDDILIPAEDLAVNPAIATLAPGEQRLVRCSLPAPKVQGVEQQWRFLVDELPTESTPVAPNGVRTLLRLSIPVFRTPVGAQPALFWALVRLGDGHQALRLSNRGARYSRITAIRLTSSHKGETRLERSFYLLHGGSIVIPLGAAQAADLAAVSVETTKGALSASPMLALSAAPLFSRVPPQ